MSRSNIGIVGLGLIGGSFGRAIREYTPHHIYGYDIDKQTMLLAKQDGILDGSLENHISDCNIIVIALNAGTAETYLQNSAPLFKNGTIVIDCCGVKRDMCEIGTVLSAKHGFYFVGGHPMAGRELSGYSASQRDLFQDASMILSPAAETPRCVLDELESLFRSIGFTRIVYTDPQTHDRIIAYTSQLAHIVSVAFVQSDTAMSHDGYSAGSFRDLTRVAYLNEKMWSELFLKNSDNLLFELDGIIERLNRYRSAISNSDVLLLETLLHAGKLSKLACSGTDRDKQKV